MKKFFKGLTLVLAILSSTVLTLSSAVSASLPDEYQVTHSSGIQINALLPVSAKTNSGKELVEAGVLQSPNQSYRANLMLLDLIPIKQVDVRMVEEVRVIPCGTPFGVKIFTDGVVVVGLTDVKTAEGTCNPAKEAGLKAGDVILSIGGQRVNTNEEVAQCFKNCNGTPLTVSVRRSNMNFETQIVPVKSETDNGYKAGLWVRDSSAGIGTLTFYNESTGMFGGLGHGICDVDTGELMPLLNGDIVSATINGVVKGTKGAPGELRGYFSSQQASGTLLANVNTGVYGKMNQAPVKHEAVPIAMKQQVAQGKAQILTTIEGQVPKYYDIEIESVNYSENTPTKNMVIHITDPALLEATGGIVQGMSGSPILQNGMLVGAVTHVFVNDPGRGYGIFAENMESVASTVQEMQQKNAS